MLAEKDRILNKKIALILEYINEPSSAFADIVGISRPAMSHIINFRNKPSLEIIQKILAKFPEMGFEWTFDGVEMSTDILIKVDKAYKQLKAEQEQQTLRDSFNLTDELGQQQLFNSVSKASPENLNKKVKTIVLVYDDGSIEHYHPNN